MITIEHLPFLCLIILLTSVVLLIDGADNDEREEEEASATPLPLYYFRYGGPDGSERIEEGTWLDKDTGKYLRVAGSYSFENDDTITYVTYLADENGYRPIIQVKRKINNVLPEGFTLDNRIDPKLLGSLAGGGLG